jgi:hypothetical protein
MYFFLVEALLNISKTKQLNFVLAYPQAPVEQELSIKKPKGVYLGKSNNNKEYVLQIPKNINGQKQAGWVWY